MVVRTLLHLRPGKAQKPQPQCGIEDRPGLAQPVAQRVFLEADRALRALGEAIGNLHRLRIQFGVLDGQADEPDPIGATLG